MFKKENCQSVSLVSKCDPSLTQSSSHSHREGGGGLPLSLASLVPCDQASEIRIQFHSSP
jgi:hypothetical protein